MYSMLPNCWNTRCMKLSVACNQRHAEILCCDRDNTVTHFSNLTSVYAHQCLSDRPIYHDFGQHCILTVEVCQQALECICVDPVLLSQVNNLDKRHCRYANLISNSCGILNRVAGDM